MKGNLENATTHTKAEALASVCTHWLRRLEDTRTLSQLF